MRSSLLQEGNKLFPQQNAFKPLITVYGVPIIKRQITFRQNVDVYEIFI